MEDDEERIVNAVKAELDECATSRAQLISSFLWTKCFSVNSDNFEASSLDTGCVDDGLKLFKKILALPQLYQPSKYIKAAGSEE